MIKHDCCSVTWVISVLLKSTRKWNLFSVWSGSSILLRILLKTTVGFETGHLDRILDTLNQWQTFKQGIWRLVLWDLAQAVQVCEPLSQIKPAETCRAAFVSQLWFWFCLQSRLRLWYGKHKIYYWRLRALCLLLCVDFQKSINKLPFRDKKVNHNPP